MIKKYETDAKYIGHNGYTPDIIAVHNTDGTKIDSAHYTFINKKNEVSAHYLVGLDGEIRQYVELENSSWCNCTSIKETANSYYKRATNPIVNSRAYNCNYYSISIEFVGKCKSALTPEQEEAFVEIAKEILKVYPNMKIDVEHIVPHCQICPKTKSSCGVNIDIAALVTKYQEAVKPKKKVTAQKQVALEVDESTAINLFQKLNKYFNG